MYLPETDLGLRGHPRLNFDILRLVCDSLTDIPDVLSLALTCSALMEDALRRRLRMAPIDLSNAEIIHSFHTFIFSNEQSRAPCVYGLKITGPYYDLQDIYRPGFSIVEDHLVDILEAAVYIQYLDFATSISPIVFDAVSRLSIVRELRILADTPPSFLLSHLPNLRFPLRSLHLVGSAVVASDTVSASFLHDRLNHLASTLEFLDLDNFPVDISPSSVTTQFTAVRSLKLKIHLISRDLHPLDVLLCLFPKLDNKLTLGPLSTNIRDDDYSEFRQRSKAAQEQHAWPRLEELVCDAETAYLIALQCPVRHMHLEVGWSGAARYFGETLREQSLGPQLSVHLSLYDGFGALDGLFPPEAADRLTHLVIFADIEVRQGRRSCRHRGDNTPSERLVNRIIRSIRHLRLTHLRIVFHFTAYQSLRNARTPNEDPAANSVVASGMDLGRTAARFVDAMPSLQYVFLTTCGEAHAIPSRRSVWSPFRPKTLHKWLSSKAFRVVHDRENIHHDLESTDVRWSACVELNQEVAESVASEEELQISREEEEMVWECRSSA